MKYELPTYASIVKSSQLAINELSRPNCDGTFDEHKELREAGIAYHKLIAEACDKQVAKPIEYAARCLICDEIWYGHGDGHCNNCGQKLEDVNYRKEVQK